MEEIYFRGDTFFRTYKCDYENSDYIFQSGDVLKVAFCKSDNKFLEKEIEVADTQSKIEVIWTAEEMAQLNCGTYVLEAELKTKEFTITYQEKIKIKEDYITENYITEGDKND